MSPSRFQHPRGSFAKFRKEVVPFSVVLNSTVVISALTNVILWPVINLSSAESLASAFTVNAAISVQGMYISELGFLFIHIVKLLRTKWPFNTPRNSYSSEPYPKNIC